MARNGTLFNGFTYPIRVPCHKLEEKYFNFFFFSPCEEVCTELGSGFPAMSELSEVRIDCWLINNFEAIFVLCHILIESRECEKSKHLMRKLYFVHLHFAKNRVTNSHLATGHTRRNE